MVNWFKYLADKLMLGLIVFVFISACSLLERRQYDYAYQKINENEILVDFKVINPDVWDTLLFINPYIQSEKIGIGNADSEFLAFHAGTENYVVVGFLKDGDLIGYTLASRETDFSELLDNDNNILVRKIPRSEAIFRFVKKADGYYQMK